MTALCPSLKALDVALCDYLSRKEPMIERDIRQAGEALDAWLCAKAKLDEANTRTGEIFNPLDLIPVKETIHSRILGELLNPKGSHGQGKLFLECFLQHLDVPEPEKGEWHITVEAGRVDIMLSRERPASVILIENKSNDAGDQLNQLYRYWHRYVHQPYPELDYEIPQTRRSFRVIYLPTDDSKAPAPHSLERPPDSEDNGFPTVPMPCETISFGAVVGLLRRKALVRVPASNVRLLTFLDFYHEFWSTP